MACLDELAQRSHGRAEGVELFQPEPFLFRSSDKIRESLAQIAYDPLIDGYLILVGLVPKNRPRGAVLAMFQTEAEAIRQISDGGDPPVDTDAPRFRYYELPGA